MIAQGLDYYQLKHEISNGMRLQKPTLCPEMIAKIMQSCFNEFPEQRPSFTDLASQFDQAFKLLKKVHVSDEAPENRLDRNIDYLQLQNSESMKAQYIEMKTQNSRARNKKNSTIKKLGSLEENQTNRITSSTSQKSMLVYVNASFEPTEEGVAQLNTKTDLKLNDPTLYTPMSNALPLLDVVGTDSSNPNLQNKMRRCNSIQGKFQQHGCDKNALKAAQSCNPLYMVLDKPPSSPSSPSLLNASKECADHKRKTICYMQSAENQYI